MEKMRYGFGVVDVDFIVQPTINGKRTRVPSYGTWSSMIERCYGEKSLIKIPAYKECFVNPIWSRFSKFHEWYLDQYKEQGWELDKDLLVKGNKEYSPDKCIFVPKYINQFTNEHTRGRGDYLLGVGVELRTGKYKARCWNPFTRKREYLGCFKTQVEAHQAWKKRKHEHSCKLAEVVHDERLAEALRIRYL